MKSGIILSLLLTFGLQSAHALEIDEKLTLRFLKVSSTKKTVLINRGAEDGLVVGDHAKFFITAGVVARGVAEKVSPSRSIWSLYRVVDPNEITEDKVLNLKIASPVKITDDPTKSMKEEEIPGGTESMNMDADAKSSAADESSTKEIVVDEADQAELEEMGMEPSAPTKKTNTKTMTGKTPGAASEEILELPSKMGTNRSDNWELWGMLYINSLSGKNETTTTSSDVSASTIDFSAGLERYFLDSPSFIKDLSFTLFIHKRTTESGSDVTITNDWTEFGIGANYHFYNPAYALNRPVLFGSFTVGKGSESNESAVPNTTTTPVTEEGDSMFFSLGIGAKYTLNNGFGARAVLDYYSSKETYSYSDGSETERSLAGPRLQFGLSYRF